MMGLFANSWSNTLKFFNMSRTSKTPHMRVPKTIPPTTRVSKSSSTYQGTHVDSVAHLFRLGGNSMYTKLYIFVP